MINFSKYHGCGNDFIITREAEVSNKSYSELAQAVCHRKIGIGADGLIIVKGRPVEDGLEDGEDPLEMVFYNCDGSRAPMCGNGIRCFAKYCYDEEICTRKEYKIETLAGTMGVKVVETDPFLVEINMGKPIFTPETFGVDSAEKDFLKQTIMVDGEAVPVSSCFMGTVHTVIWLEELNQFAGGKAIDFKEGSKSYEMLEKLGKSIESHPVYKEKTNVNMVEVIDRNTLKLQTYERGVGMTLACGTGACASLVIGALENKCMREVDVILPYGKLHITQKEDGEVMMRGPAEKICQGTFSWI
ncbi:diaminopimelate epimerase [Anaerovorax odorimutans]|uniref:diaminopimelate epimerase n=1 Tax=Anaerovorax odorimutans TaxID=109327 RepID=UPI000424AC6D|nr:diaminopimelate epimerase [Anaerovorax odorimutans]